MTCGSAWFRDAEVEHESATYRVTAAELAAALPYQHARAPGDPDTWLCADAYRTVRSRHPALPTATLLELTARTLGISAAHLRGQIEWHEQYMRFHDGDHDYEVL